MKEKINIQGFDIYCSLTDMNIINSYKVSSIAKMKSILIEALDTTIIYKTNRTMNSLINEWIAHNILYKYNLYRKHTKDCNFESKQKIRVKIVYFILSRIEKIKYYLGGCSK